VPPHPGPLVAIDALKVDLGVTLALGVLVAIPTIAVSGPLVARYAARWVDVPASDPYGAVPQAERALVDARTGASGSAGADGVPAGGGTDVDVGAGGSSRCRSISPY
jgi:H+/gluconate symporter-like permease